MGEREPNIPENIGENFEAQPTKKEAIERPIIERSSESIENVPVVNTPNPTHQDKVDTNKNVLPSGVESVANNSVTVKPPELQVIMDEVFRSSIETEEDQNNSDAENVAA